MSWMSSPRISGIYAITPDLIDTTNLVMLTQQVLISGVQLIQYRNKIADNALKLEQAALLSTLCHEFNTPLIINDDLDLAIKVGADGVHLGIEDITVVEARRRLGPGKIIGASCYNKLRYAIEAGKSWCRLCGIRGFLYFQYKIWCSLRAYKFIVQGKAVPTNPSCCNRRN